MAGTDIPPKTRDDDSFDGCRSTPAGNGAVAHAA